MTDPAVVFDDVSKFYGEVLGVNRVTLNIPPGITSLVGPNGSGKTTLMNLMTGLLFPDRGSVSVRGISPRNPEALMRITGTPRSTTPRRAGPPGSRSSPPGCFFSDTAERRRRNERGKRSSASVSPTPRPAKSRRTPRGCGSECGWHRPSLTIPMSLCWTSR